MKRRKQQTITWSHPLIFSLPLSLPSFPDAININALLWCLIQCLFSPLWLVVLPIFSVPLFLHLPRASFLHPLKRARPCQTLVSHHVVYVVLPFPPLVWNMQWVPLSRSGHDSQRPWLEELGALCLRACLTVCVCVLSKVICNCMFSDTVMDNQ